MLQWWAQVTIYSSHEHSHQPPRSETFVMYLIILQDGFRIESYDFDKCSYVAVPFLSFILRKETKSAIASKVFHPTFEKSVCITFKQTTSSLQIVKQL